MSVDSINAPNINSAILDAIQSSIPRGCRANYKPFWNDKLEKLIKEGNKARSNLDNDDGTNNKIEYKKAVKKAQFVTKESKKEAWTSKCEGLNLRPGGQEAWNLLNNLSGEIKQTNPSLYIQLNNN